MQSLPEESSCGAAESNLTGPVQVRLELGPVHVGLELGVVVTPRLAGTSWSCRDILVVPAVPPASLACRTNRK